MSILASFVGTPREGQRSTLAALEANWSSSDLFVVEAPTGSGKSHIALTVARWAQKVHKQKSMLLVPNNVLLQQYLSENPKLATLQAKHSYECKTLTGRGLNGIYSCKESADIQGKTCKDCPYTIANRRIRAVPYGLVNYWTYLAHKLYPEILIVDEAHNLLGMLREMAGKKLWRREYQYPDWVKDYRSVLRWVEQELEYRPTDTKLLLLRNDLVSGRNAFLVEKGTDLYRGHEQECLKMLPIDTSKSPPLLWPSKVKKIILLSATIGVKDIEQLGLAKRRCSWLHSASPIPAPQRPFVQRREGFDLSYAAQGKDIPDLAQALKALLFKHTGERGLIHVTYSLMDALRAQLDSSPRLLWHTKENKKEKYTEFLNGPTDAVLLCAGLYEGIDLPGDLGRFQVITKVPWASLAEPAMKWLAETERDRYTWETLRLVMQAAGRVCRGPTDYGITYCLDRTFGNIPEEQMPAWFRESVQAGEQLMRGEDVA